MKINNEYKISVLHNKKKQNKDTKNDLIPANSQDIKESSAFLSNYNVAFSGLSSKVDYDSRNNLHNVIMHPQKRYFVSPDAKFKLGPNYILDLSRSDVQQKLQNNMTVIVGRAAFLGDETDATVSREHLMLQKYDDDRIIACDMNTVNGTNILPSEVQDLSSANNCVLNPNKKYIVPRDAVFQLAHSTLNFVNYKNLINNMMPNSSLMIGRDIDNDIILPDETVSRYHMKLTKASDGTLIVQDLDSRNGTKYVGSSGEFQKIRRHDEQRRVKINNSFNNKEYIDISGINYIEQLGQSKKYILPKNSQLLVGDDYVIDIRNPLITKLLNSKNSVSIGSSYFDDINIADFHSNVADHHVVLKKENNSIVAIQNRYPGNKTYVIPQSQIRPFIKGAKNIEISQANIGDCYLLSTIYSLSRTKTGAGILENMVSVQDDGSYLVEFPNMNPIKVNADELDGQTQSDGQVKYSVKGELGVKAIERAYGKALKQMNMQKFAGRNLAKGDDNYSKTLFGVIDEGGWMKDALYTITGIKSNDYFPQHAKNIDYMLEPLSRINKENRFATCSTPFGKYGKYCDKKHKFIGKHAYSIGNIDARSRTIEIINPHNTKKSEVITWDEFKEIFTKVTTVNI